MYRAKKDGMNARKPGRRRESQNMANQYPERRSRIDGLEASLGPLDKSIHLEQNAKGDSGKRHVQLHTGTRWCTYMQLAVIKQLSYLNWTFARNEPLNGQSNRPHRKKRDNDTRGDGSSRILKC